MSFSRPNPDQAIYVISVAAELAESRAEGSAAVEEVHRSYRRDLVPMDQSVVIYRREARK